MSKEFKFQILWSTRNKPSEIREMTSDDRINELITSGRWRCKIGSFGIGNSKEPGIEMTIVKPTDPHGYIEDIYLDYDEEKWYGDVTVPSTKTDWIEMIESMDDPVLHPLVIGGTTQCMIVMFAIIERSKLSNNTYDGNHYPVTTEEVILTYRIAVASKFNRPKFGVTSKSRSKKDYYIARAKSESEAFDMLFDYIAEDNTYKMYNNLGNKDDFKQVSTSPVIYESSGIIVTILRLDRGEINEIIKGDV